MNRFFTLLLAASCLTAVGQVTYPYNPDWDSDSLITVNDLQDLLSIYGSSFSPLEVQVGEQSLSDALAAVMTNQLEMQSIIAAQQEYIQALQQHISVTEGQVLISGANLQVVSGLGQTDGEVNGKGNVIVGYDEDFANVKTGSHNLVIGSYHNYTSFGGLVSGYENSILGEFCSVTGGAFNSASGINCTILGGGNNAATGNMTVIAGGSTNHALGNRTSILGGLDNIANQNLSTVVGDSSLSYLDRSAPENAID